MTKVDEVLALLRKDPELAEAVREGLKEDPNVQILDVRWNIAEGAIWFEGVIYAFQYGTVVRGVSQSYKDELTQLTVNTAEEPEIGEVFIHFSSSLGTQPAIRVSDTHCWILSRTRMQQRLMSGLNEYGRIIDFELNDNE